jgi:peptidoglycan hydrolase-like protein with peptidoglycan-binding domain
MIGARSGAADGERPSRRWLAVAAVALAGVATAAVAVAATGGESKPRAAASTFSGASAPVQRRTLVTRENVEGTLGYAGRRTAVNRLTAAGDTADAPVAESDAGRAGGAVQPAGAAGADTGGGSTGGGGGGAVTLTALPSEGALLGRGDVLYRADGEPVLLLYGTTPAFRDLAAGDSGEDVLQLERNLLALGHSPGVVDGDFTTDTAAAVAAWQESVGLDESGEVELGRVAFLPGARRVGGHVATVGDLLSDGTAVVETGSDRRNVEVELDVDMQSLVRKGDRVTVLLPGGVDTVDGRIVRVGRVARAKEDSSATGGDQATGAEQELVIDVTVKLASRRGLGRLDQAPVSVGIAQETRRKVLAIPVTALIARPGGGYAVRVVGGGRGRLLPVEPGLYADGLVEVSGDGLRAGMRVEAAAT